MRLKAPITRPNFAAHTFLGKLTEECSSSPLERAYSGGVIWVSIISPTVRRHN